MHIADRHLADDEQLVHATRQHWTEMVSEFVVLCLVWAVAGALIWVLPTGEDWASTGAYVVVAAAVVASVWWWLVPLIKWRSKMYILTTKRIYKRSGFLTKTSRSIPLLRVNDVAFKATLWERIMRYGTLTIQSASEHGTMTLRHVPRPEWFKTEIYRAVDAEQGGGQQWGPPPPVR